MPHFCEKSGARIANPGVSKAIDPINGHDEVIEIDGVEEVLVVKKPRVEKPKGEGDKKPEPGEKTEPEAPATKKDGAPPADPAAKPTTK